MGPAPEMITWLTFDLPFCLKTVKNAADQLNGSKVIENRAVQCLSSEGHFHCMSAVS